MAREQLNGEAVIEHGLKGLEVTDNIISCVLSYNDYEGDRIAIEESRPASWDEVDYTKKPLGSCVRVPVEYYVTEYTPETSHPGMYTQ